MSDWDRTHDWEVQRFTGDRLSFSIRLAGDKPTLAELRALRECFIQFRTVPVSELRTTVTRPGSLEFTCMHAMEARPLIEAARALGLQVDVQRVPYVIISAYDRTAGCMLQCDDEQERKAIIASMLEAGVPISEMAE